MLGCHMELGPEKALWRFFIDKFTLGNAANKHNTFASDRTFDLVIATSLAEP